MQPHEALILAAEMQVYPPEKLFRQREDKLHSSTGSGTDRDLTLMQQDCIFNYCKPQSGSAALARPSVVNPVKLLEDPCLVLFRDTYAIVCEGEGTEAWFPGNRPDCDGNIFTGVGNGILQQVLED